MPHEATHYRVSKKLAPDTAGAIKLAQQYGDTLLCVRHRISPDGQTRFTTVELVVEQAPLRAKATDHVGVDIAYNERQLRSVVMAAGAQWSPKDKLWHMPLRVVRSLGLQDRIRKGG